MQEEKTALNKEEDTCVSYEEEDTCVSYEEDGVEQGGGYMCVI